MRTVYHMNVGESGRKGNWTPEGPAHAQYGSRAPISPFTRKAPRMRSAGSKQGHVTETWRISAHSTSEWAGGAGRV